MGVSQPATDNETLSERSKHGSNWDTAYWIAFLLCIATLICTYYVRKWETAARVRRAVEQQKLMARERSLALAGEYEKNGEYRAAGFLMVRLSATEQILNVEKTSQLARPDGNPTPDEEAALACFSRSGDSALHEAYVALLEFKYKIRQPATLGR